LSVFCAFERFDSDELLFLSSSLLVGIQLRKNLFDIETRFFKHMKSYDYKFKSLGKCRET
jgi:hypothetical protein